MRGGKVLCMAVALSLLLTGCAGKEKKAKIQPSPSAQPTAKRAEKPSASPETGYALPDVLQRDETGTAMVRVYLTETEEILEVPLEDYIMGVVAGEMSNAWPLEALKSQAVVARTFALRSIADGGSKYEGAQLSNDVEEAQAFAPEDVNERVREAVEATRGEILLYEGQPIHAWFHAHAGGVTATAQEGLNFAEKEPPYIRSIQIRESAEAPQEVQNWQAEFSMEEMQAALDELGGGDAAQLAIYERGPSGRVAAFSAGDAVIPAVELRLKLGGTRMKSTLLSAFEVTESGVFMSGSGYGHGVGLSQWGAYEMAQEGKDYRMILNKFYKDVMLYDANARTAK